jgi:lipopolysaccharide export system protein LptA
MLRREPRLRLLRRHRIPDETNIEIGYEFTMEALRHKRSGSFGMRSALGLSALMALAVFATPVQAQTRTVSGVPNAVQGFSKNRGQPIQIDALSLEVRDKDKIATFSGNVKVVQGDTTMRSKTLVVFYDQDPKAAGAKPAMKTAQPGPGGSSSVRRLEARGGVIVTQNDQTVTGQTGIFDMKTNTVTMTGGVVLTKDKNVLKGDRLVVDMTTGVSRVESSGGRGVSGLFNSTSPNKNGGGLSLVPGSSPKTETEPPARTPGKPMRLNHLQGRSGARG